MNENEVTSTLKTMQRLSKKQEAELGVSLEWREFRVQRPNVQALTSFYIPQFAASFICMTVTAASITRATCVLSPLSQSIHCVKQQQMQRTEQTSPYLCDSVVRAKGLVETLLECGEMRPQSISTWSFYRRCCRRKSEE